MDDERYEEAIAEARVFREAARFWESRRPSEVAADELVKVDSATLVHHLRVLIGIFKNTRSSLGHAKPDRGNSPAGR